MFVSLIRCGCGVDCPFSSTGITGCLTLLQVVHCWSCDATVAAGGMSNASLKNKGDKIKRESFVMDKSPALDLSTPNNKRHGKSTPSNRKQCDSTPSNKRRRSSTLKAQLAKSSSHQRQLEVGTSPNLSAFLSSIL